MSQKIDKVITAVNDMLILFFTWLGLLFAFETKECSDGSRISPRGGVNPPRGGREHTILPNSPKNCMKLKEFGCRGGGGACVPHAPLDPPLEWK